MISLEKRAEKVGIILAKHDIVKVPPVRVGLALDVSGSMKNLYMRGVMQDTVDRLLAISIKFDDNGELDMWVFDDSSTQLDTATSEDYNTYVEENIINSDLHLWGGTAYGAVLQDMNNFWFASKPKVEKKSKFFGLISRDVVVGREPASTLPAMGLLVTDGETSDQSLTDQILRESSSKNVYWQMVGVGPAHHFDFLRRVADKYSHVGFVNLSSLEQSDDEIYDQLISSEFTTWVKSIKTA